MSAELALVAKLGKRVDDLDSLISDIEVRSKAESSSSSGSPLIVEITTGQTTYTTTGDEDIIVCNNTASCDITMTIPKDGHKTTYIRRDAAVNLIGTLNGTTPTAIPSQYDILDVYYTLAGGEFNA